MARRIRVIRSVSDSETRRLASSSVFFVRHHWVFSSSNAVSSKYSEVFVASYTVCTVGICMELLVSSNTVSLVQVDVSASSAAHAVSIVFLVGDCDILFSSRSCVVLHEYKLDRFNPIHNNIRQCRNKHAVLKYASIQS